MFAFASRTRHNFLAPFMKYISCDVANWQF